MLGSSAKAMQRFLSAAEQDVVRAQLVNFERMHPATSIPSNRHASDSSDSSAGILNTRPTPTMQARPPLSVSAKHIGAKGQGSRALVDQLTVPPFSGASVHGERSILAEAQQVQEAVTWLRECPSRTLRLLQQRVLRATETLFTRLVGMPVAARQVLAQVAAERQPAAAKQNARTGGSDDDDDEGNGVVGLEYVLPPQPLTFSDFLSGFLLDSPAGAASTSSAMPFHLVLLSGRPLPVAPLTSLHVVYGLHVVEEVLRRPSLSTASSASCASPTAVTGLEDHQALLSEVVHWATFFESVFDKATEGLCRDPLNLHAAVLLACAERGAWERHNTADALAEEAVRQLKLSVAASGRRPDVCVACRTEAARLADSCRSYVKHTLRTVAASQHPVDRSGSRSRAEGGKSSSSSRVSAPVTRFFLATPAVVWWAAAFLRLYRLRTPVAAPCRAPAEKRASGSSALLFDGDAQAAATDDVVSSAEAYFIRDWIARAARMDREGLVEQEDTGCLCIPLSCATHAPVAVFGFTQENVQTALDRMTTWADAGVVANAPLRVDELLAALQDEYAVLPYFLSYFSGV
ncbi:hypothetical protein GH5_06057 [Leishmania sp. Ghana 2012 LV757]|uniref:hypothetical protein n=1 Tax=Leishmania sp. Ghana 2012 LV757 TaxID=2803181 RepID=UPI001B4CB419|nr:hypothetical protein GH5_06057 [Leishmania sp. Ghana 2012 LV757]